MKIKTSLVALCMLMAAGATGTPDRVTQKPVSDSAFDENSAMADSAIEKKMDTKWQYAPASRYVPPKVPI